MQSLEVQQPSCDRRRKSSMLPIAERKKSTGPLLRHCPSELPTMHQTDKTITSKPLSSKSLLWCFSFLHKIGCFVPALTSTTLHNLTQCCLFSPLNTFFLWQSWYRVPGFSSHFSYSSPRVSPWWWSLTGLGGSFFYSLWGIYWALLCVRIHMKLGRFIPADRQWCLCSQAAYTGVLGTAPDTAHMPPGQPRSPPRHLHVPLSHSHAGLHIDSSN